MSEWYYSQHGQKHGPVSSSELKELAASGELLPSDLLWKEGQKTSSPAAKAKGLFSSASTKVESPKPPALSSGTGVRSPPPPPPPVVAESFHSKKQALIFVLSGGAILLVLLSAVIVFVSGDGNDDGNTQPASGSNSTSSSKADAPTFVSGDRNDADGNTQPDSGSNRTSSSETNTPTNELAEKYVKTSYEPPVIVPPFDTIDYSKGPNGEPLRKREKVNQKGMIVIDQCFVDRNGKEISHGLGMVRTPEGQNLWESFKKAGVAHGLSREWDYENGQLTIRGTYIDGKKHGLWKHWYQDGTPALVEHWHEGLHDGVATVFYKNGRMKIQVEWRDGEKNGRFYQWYENGNLQESGSYVDGVQDQVWIGRHESGTKSFQENWNEGRLVGREIRWSEDGDIIFDKDWSGRSDKYINGYRGQWSLGRLMGEKYKNASSDLGRAYFMRGFQMSLAQWEERRDDLIRQLGADYPEAQKLLGLCDGYQDGFESAQTE